MTRPALARFLRDRSGAALVEFAISLPLVLLVFAVIVESGRVFWGYQAAVAGVREASRYLARVTPQDICITGGSLSGMTTRVEQIVAQSVTGAGILPDRLTLVSAIPDYTCVPGPFRLDPAPVAQVTAELRIELPFSGIRQFFGTLAVPVETTISDTSRVFGI
ncbi:MAG: TadE/TadG family type IV pilus assembly protein [Gemmobacter sp.]